MELSLSGRVVESGNKLLLTVREFFELASRNGYKAVDLRASQFGPDTSDGDFNAIQSDLSETGLRIFEGAYNGKLDAPGKKDFMKLANRLGILKAQGIRMGGDLSTLKHACVLVAPLGLKIFCQTHTGGFFETIASTEKAIAEINEPNFAVLPEPSNLLMARVKFSEDMFTPLKGRIGGVHVQTIEVHPYAQQTLRLSDGTDVKYERVDYEQNTQIDFPMFFKALRQAGFDGYVNELEPCPGDGKLEDTVTKAANFLSRLVMRKL